MEAKSSLRFERAAAMFTVLACTIVGAAFRLWGIGWELPGKLHKFTYHPDEIFQVGALVNLNPFALKLDPEFYNYPSGYMNLASVVLRLSEAYGMKIDEANVYLIARLVTASLGILTIPVIYFIGRRMYGSVVGAAACFIYAIMPLGIIHAHFATVDVPSAFWTACAIFAAAAVLSKPSAKNCILAGLAAGAAAGTKYNCALVLLSVFTAIAVSGQRKIKVSVLFGKIGLSLLGTIIGFIAASPGVLIWTDKYISGFLYELGHAAAGHGLVFAGRGPGWLDVLSSAFGSGLGIPMLAAVLLASALAVTRHKREDLVILAFVLPYFMLVAFSQVRFTRYAMPLIPPAAVLIARLIIEIYELLRSQRVRAAKAAWALCSVGVVLYTILYAAALTRLFTEPDPRNQAFRWLRENTLPNTSIGLATVPWFYSPPYTPEINGLPLARDRYMEMKKSPWRLIIGGKSEDSLPSWQASVPSIEKPMYIIISDYEYEDGLRVRDPKTLEFMRQTAANYIEKAKFAPRIQFIGLDFGPAEFLPHDLKYMAPTIRIYQRR